MVAVVAVVNLKPPKKVPQKTRKVGPKPRFWRKKPCGDVQKLCDVFLYLCYLVFFWNFWCTDWFQIALMFFFIELLVNIMMSGVLGNKARGKRTNQGMANCWDIKRPTTLWQTLGLKDEGFGQTHWVRTTKGYKLVVWFYILYMFKVVHARGIRIYIYTHAMYPPSMHIPITFWDFIPFLSFLFCSPQGKPPRFASIFFHSSWACP